VVSFVPRVYKQQPEMQGREQSPASMSCCGSSMMCGYVCCLTLAASAGAAVQETVLRLRFVSPPQHTLSGTHLESGMDASSMEPAEFAEFYGELTAQPELREVLW